MRTWRRGITAVRARLAALTEPPERFLSRLASGDIPRVPGTAVFLTRVAQPVPLLLVRHVAQLGAVQERIVSLNVTFEEVPRVPLAERVAVSSVAEGFWHVTVHFGFVEVPSLPAALEAARRNGCPIDVEQAMYFGGHDDLVPRKHAAAPARLAARDLRLHVPQRRPHAGDLLPAARPLPRDRPAGRYLIRRAACRSGPGHRRSTAAARP